MTEAARWQTSEPCPDCGTDLTLLDDGAITLTAECRGCGRSVTWQVTPARGDQ